MQILTVQDNRSITFYYPIPHTGIHFPLASCKNYFSNLNRQGGSTNSISRTMLVNNAIVRKNTFKQKTQLQLSVTMLVKLQWFN